MFKREKVGEDILFDMEKNLRKNAFDEDTRKTNEKIEAMNLLEKAASNFESVGKMKEAEAVTRIIEYVSTLKPKLAMDSKQQVKNMEETGTQWPRESFPVEDGDPEDKEAKLYEEYLKNPEIAADIKVEEDPEDMSKQEFAALSKLWE